MPIRLSDITGRTKKVEIKINLGESVEKAHVWYKPANYSIDLFAEFLGDTEEDLSEEDLAEMAEQDNPEFMNRTMSFAQERAERIPYVLDRLISGWDIVDEHNQPLEPNFELLSQLDLPFLNTLMAAIMQDMQDDQSSEGNASKTNSRNGSRRTGSLAGARGGTR